MNIERNKNTIVQGKAVLGIEIGSTRIKTVLINENNEPIASGGYEWENQWVNNIWTYSEKDIWTGIQQSYQAMVQNVKDKFQVNVRKLAAIGISGMMHGYMPFNQDGGLLVSFRTWRNTMTEEASQKLTQVFHYPIPQRWSIAHLYQAILNQEKHVSDITFMTTLSGYVHWKLTGEKVVGIGDASGMFPIDIGVKNYDKKKIKQFSELISSYGFSWKLEDIMPKILVAGEEAGRLTQEGARLLDVTGELESGIPLCPPEGDAGTGMVATNSVEKRTGNVSAGTSVFAMVVLEKELSHVYSEIDLVTTPTGKAVAMVHCNNCTSDLNAWVEIFKEFLETMGLKVNRDRLFEILYRKAMEGDCDCGGLLAYNYFSGEHIIGLREGRPLFVRTPDSCFNLANFIKVHLSTALGALKSGMDILLKEEGIKLDRILAHGGLFKTRGVGQSILAAALNTPVSVMKMAGEGGAWGIALLASYLVKKDCNQTLENYLNHAVFDGQSEEKVQPDKKEVDGFNEFMLRYQMGLPIERAAVDCLKIV